jgi:transposase-like protein
VINNFYYSFFKRTDFYYEGLFGTFYSFFSKLYKNAFRSIDVPPKSQTLIGGIFMRKNKKHDFDFLLRIVREVIKGRHTPSSISRKVDIRKSMVERWVSFYRSYGIDGLKPISNSYSADFRLNAVRTMKAESLSLYQASLRFKIPSVSTLQN